MRTEEFQFGAMMVTAMLTLTLVTQVPRHVGRTVNRSRWLMVVSMVLLFVQFLLQYTYGFRTRSVTLGVAVNLLFFIPCSCLMTVALLYLQRHGTVPKSVWATGGLCWGAAILLLATMGGVSFADGQLTLNDIPATQTAEYIAAIGFCATQIWYYNLHRKEHKKLKRALNNFNDDDTDELLQWMHNSVMMLAAVAVLVPLAIFQSGPLLILFSVFFFCAIYYCIVRFYRYSVSTTPELVEEAQQREKEDEDEEDEYGNARTRVENTEVNAAIIKHVETAVTLWTERKGYLHKKATVQRVADEMNVTRAQLSAWLKATDRVFNQWINNLRIEEAKRLLKEHPEWANDSIADACGFGSRTYFQTIFKENTGLTPAQFCSEE